MKLVKACLLCGRHYEDLTYSFCLDDGGLLSTPFDQSRFGDGLETETVIRSSPTQPIQTAPTNPADPQAADIKEPEILITTGRLYKPGIPASTLYETTRGIWKIGPRRNQAKYAFAAYKAIIREAQKIQLHFSRDFFGNCFAIPSNSSPSSRDAACSGSC